MASQELVLLVDDDEVYRNRLRRAFTDRGWKAVAVANGRDAIDVAAKEAPHLAIVDLRLPGIGGLEIIRGIRCIHEEMCIIVLTGYGSIATALAAMKFGASHYLGKPVDVDQILGVYSTVRGEREGASEESASYSVPSLARVEWEHIQRVLADCDGNISHAAKLLGLHRRSLQRKLGKYPPRS